MKNKKNGTINLRRSEQLRETIEERIATGRYLPGMRLDETELATEFGVSRTPIREALIQLASGGLVEIKPRRSAIIAAVSPQRLYEMFEVMAELEAMCVRLAVRRITDAELKTLLKLHEGCEAVHDKEDPDCYYRCNEQFHLEIYRASHNSFLIEEATALHLRLRPYRRLQLRVRDRMHRSFSEHAEVLEAITAGDGELAVERIRNHIVVQGDRFADLLASLSSLGSNGESAPPDMV
jgi:DNA-binding GntR family transcriptional regulator